MKKQNFYLFLISLFFIFQCDSNESKKLKPKKVWKVTFEVDGGSEINALNVIDGEKAIRPSDSKKEDYNLENWYKDIDRYYIFDFSKEVITSNITLYARWEHKLFPSKLSSTDYGIDDCSAKDKPAVKNFWNGTTDVTFLAFGDCQITILDNNISHKNHTNYGEALNSVGKVDWKKFGVNQTVKNVRGVIVAGDITANGRDGRFFSANEYGEFTKIYGLCGNRKVNFPIYEGYGNHDYFEWEHRAYRISKVHPIVDSVSIRNEHRMSLVNKAPGRNGHYSWEWDDIRFIQLNLCASDVDPKHKVSGVRNPRKSLSFLKNDLQKIDHNKKVIIITHYGPKGDFEFDQKQEQDLYETIKNYNVIAYIHGHNHNTSFYYWNKIPVFNVGSPYPSSYSYAVFRITENYIYAQDVAYDPYKPKELTFPAKWHQKISIKDIGK